MALNNMNLRVAAVLLLHIGVWVQANQLCLVGDFDTQARYLLDHEFLTQEQTDNITRVFDDIMQTLQQKWAGVKINPLGSLVTGLAAKLSDVDFVILVRNYNESSEKYLMKHSLRLLKRQPELYTQVRARYGGRGVPLIYLYHIPTQRHCDISFRSQTSVENSKLLAYYFKLDQRIVPLASLIKFWSKVHRTKAVGILRSYVLYVLIVFYLQQKDIVPPTISLQKNFVNYFDNDWDTSFTEMPYNTSNKESLYQLLGGFYQYYGKLNFSDNVLSPFVGQVIPRSVFSNISSIPEEFAMYKSYLKRPDSTPLVLDTDFCIQDMFEQNINVAESTHPEQVAEFISHAKFATKAFEELPSDSFLTTIMARDYHVLDVERDEVDEVIKLEDCTNVTSQTLD